jgi:FkbM family methyltransferase
VNAVVQKMITLLKKLLTKRFKRRLRVRLESKLGVPSLHWSLRNIHKLGFRPSHALDIGAYHGQWTQDFKEVFPTADVLMIEGQQSKSSILKQVCREHSRTKYEIVVLSSKSGEPLEFSEYETGSYARKCPLGNNSVNSISLDDVLKRHEGFTPDFIKIDVQGFELEVLRGGIVAVATAHFIMLEVTLLDFGDGMPLFLEVLNYMDSIGFQLYDISEFMRRPLDHALYQMDAIFIRKTSHLVADKRWQ